MRYKCICRYNGTAYSGSQRQDNAVTVQGEIEKSLKRIYNQPIDIHMASRTDKGVHALGQVFHYDTDIDIDVAKLATVIDRQLPNDIQVISAQRVAPDFHARFDAKRKTYRYWLSTDPIFDIFRKDICYQYNREIDAATLQPLVNHLIGEHDFKAFMAAGSDKEMTVRTIYAIDLAQTDDQFTMTITGNGFLYKMVRIIVGLQLDVAEGKKRSDDVIANFKAGNRGFFRRTAPACGLYLVETKY